jgi:lysyl-tRNA synthetase class 2
MDDTNSLIEQRKAKLAALRVKGIDPFKNKFTPGETCRHAREQYAEGREVALAGRITAHRDMGKSMFLDIRDQSGRMQIYAQKNVLGDELWEIFKHLDLGDFVGVRGTMFTTKTNEISIKLGSGTGVPPVSTESKNAAHRQDACATTETAQPPFVILAKALRPPPAKWHGLEDTEIRYRQRYLDLMASKAAAPGTSTTGFEKGSPGDVLLLRSEIIREIRNFLHERGYVEVETPMMQAIPGGAAAQPFVTKHNALGCNFYLRIALELYLKRLLVGGVDKVFEIGRNFRNEGLSRKHNPEFTMLEAYQAFGDYESMMELVESMVKHVAQKVLGTLIVPRKQSGAIASAIDQAVKMLDQISSEGFTKIVQDKSAALNKDYTEEVQTLRNQLWEIRNALGVKPDKEVAQQAQVVIMRWVSSVAIARAFPDILRLRVNEENFGEVIRPLAEELVVGLKASFFALKLAIENEGVDLSNWRRAKYKDLIRERAGADWFEISPAERRQRAHDLGAEIGKEYEDFEVTGAVFEKLIEPTLIQPTFVTHLPKELVPLAKLSPDDPTTVEVFECCINGQEIAPAYTEQNDPIAQRERLEHQAGGEQQKLDEDFLVALEHGMPPAGGMGMGIDRLCMMLLGQESIRDVILFPQLKPK